MSTRFVCPLRNEGTQIALMPISQSVLPVHQLASLPVCLMWPPDQEKESAHTQEKPPGSGAKRNTTRGEGGRGARTVAKGGEGEA